jgi:cyclophilin family peptidyl-prolyl cis-trans isomerase
LCFPPVTTQAERDTTVRYSVSGVFSFVRLFLALALVLVLAGCGSSASPAPTSTSIPPTSPPIQQWSHSPAITIDRNARYTATMATTDGTFSIQLLPKVAPIAVNNFIFLARHHFFDHNLFDRILQGQVVQTGDPTGTLTGGPGYRFKDEPVTLPYSAGTVAMANSGPNTNGSQFFIVVTPAGQALPLPPKYTIFGRVASGMSVLYKIASTPVGPAVNNPQEISDPLKSIYINHITIREQK